MRNAQHPYPATWRQYRLGEIAEEAQLGTPERGHATGEATVPLIKMGNLTWGGVNLQSVERVAVRHAANNDLILRPGDILFNTRNTLELVGKSALWRASFPEATFDNNINRLRLMKNALPDFVNLYMNHGIGKRRINALAVGSTSVAAIYWKDLQNLIIPLPPLPEQHKIAAILRTWDLGLEKLSALRNAKEFRFVGLRQRLFGGRGGYTGHWQFEPLSAITTRVRRKNDGGDHPVMTISAKSGFLMQSDKFARDMAGSSAERYTLLHQGEFAYNKGNSLTAPYGCIYELDRPTAVVPFVYYSFALNAGLDRMFYKHLFSGGILNHQLSRVINSGVRNDGLLNLDVEDFFGCKVPVPPIEEQREIGHILSTAKTELDLLDREIAALTRQKLGLMQKLLTGEWPVQVEGVAA